MRRTVTIAEPLHSWLQKIRASYLHEHEVDLSYTAALNWYLALGIGTGLEKTGKDLNKFAEQMVHPEDMAAASIQDEMDNLWLSEELPKILKKIEEDEKNKK